MEERKEKIFGLLILVGILFFLSACVSVSYLPSKATDNYPSTSSVEVFFEKPNKTYIELGLIIVETQPLLSGISRFTTEETLIEKAKEKAMSIGAQAIIITSLRQREVIGGSTGSSRTMRRMEVLAIRFE